MEGRKESSGLKALGLSRHRIEPGRKAWGCLRGQGTGKQPRPQGAQAPGGKLALAVDCGFHPPPGAPYPLPQLPLWPLGGAGLVLPPPTKPQSRDGAGWGLSPWIPLAVGEGQTLPCLCPHASPSPKRPFLKQPSAVGRGGRGRDRNDLEARTHNGPVAVWSPATERKEICPVFLPWAGMLIQDRERGG